MSKASTRNGTPMRRSSTNNDTAKVTAYNTKNKATRTPCLRFRESRAVASLLPRSLTQRDGQDTTRVFRTGPITALHERPAGPQVEPRLTGPPCSIGAAQHDRP